MKRFAIALMLGAACQVQTPIIVDRDGRGSDLGETCENLRRLGCVEGTATETSTCYERLLTQSEYMVIPDDCVREATSKEQIRACGTAGTLRFRCL